MPRVIYSLMYTFDVPPPEIVQLLVHLNRDGQSANGLAKAIPPKQRIIDLRVGDWLRFRKDVRQIKAIETYYDAYYAAGAKRFASWSEGYEVIGSPDERPASMPVMRRQR